MGNSVLDTTKLVEPDRSASGLAKTRNALQKENRVDQSVQMSETLAKVRSNHQERAKLEARIAASSYKCVAKNSTLAETQEFTLDSSSRSCSVHGPFKAGKSISGRTDTILGDVDGNLAVDTDAASHQNSLRIVNGHRTGFGNPERQAMDTSRYGIPPVELNSKDRAIKLTCTFVDPIN